MRINELTWEQQVEYRKVRKFGRDFNLYFRLRKVWFAQERKKVYLAASEVLNDC